MKIDEISLAAISGEMNKLCEENKIRRF